MTTDAITTDPTDDELRTLVTDYLRAWNETDPVTRRRIIERHWSPGCRYANSATAYDGLDGVADAMEAAYRRWGAAGHRFVAREPLDCHHATARFTWVMLDAAGLPAGMGTHLWLLDSDHRIVHDVQFPGR